MGPQQFLALATDHVLYELISMVELSGIEPLTSSLRKC
jgi:hypothetical protein